MDSYCSSHTDSLHGESRWARSPSLAKELLAIIAGRWGALSIQHLVNWPCSRKRPHPGEYGLHKLDFMDAFFKKKKTEHKVGPVGKGSGSGKNLGRDKYNPNT